MRLMQQLIKFFAIAALTTFSMAAMGQDEEEKEDPKKDAWIEQCMKDSGWYNEDGMPYCSCLAGERGISKPYSFKELKGTKAAFDCAGKLPTKEEHPKRHWISECVTSGGGDFKYCGCMGDKLTAAVDLNEWKKTKAGSDAHASCGGK